MKALSKAEIMEAEAAAAANGWGEGRLLRLAGRRLGWAVGRFFPRHQRAVGYLGKGHNAGDLMVALGVLRDEFGWEIGVRCAHHPSDWAPLLAEVWEEVGGIPVWEEEPHRGEGHLPCVLLDGLAGMGLTGGLRGSLATMAREINRMRTTQGMVVAAIDVPSGVDADAGVGEADFVTADVTFQIANPKRGLLRHEAVAALGSLVVVPVEPLTQDGPGGLQLISAPASPALILPRPHDFHKGDSGRVGILAGSREYPGAAVLAATAAIRAGAGLVYLDVPEDSLAAVVGRCPPEVIVRGVATPRESFARKLDAWVVGCGLGTWGEAHCDELLECLSEVTVPTVVDADALNQLALRGDWRRLTGRHVVTPHPGELSRLAPELESLDREQAVHGFVSQSSAVLVLKGARTLVGSAAGGIWANPTGHAGMATGGSGDWLAGVIGALLAAGHAPHDAACLGSWICGRCGELACWEGGESAQSMLPSDNARWMGRAFEDWRTGAR